MQSWEFGVLRHVGLLLCISSMFFSLSCNIVHPHHCSLFNMYTVRSHHSWGIVHTHYSKNVVKFDFHFSLAFFNTNLILVFTFILKPYSFFNPNLSTKRFQILDLNILKFKPAQAHVNKVSHLSYIIFSTSTMKKWYGAMGSALCPSDLVWVHIL